MREKFRHVGIGARPDEVIKRAINTGEIGLVLTYLEYNLLTQASARDFFPLCREKDIGVILASPMGMGLLTDRPIDKEDELRKIRNAKEPKA